MFDADEDELGVFLEERSEIPGKHLPHKRAFLASDVMVELFLVRAGRTNFWGSLEYLWPPGDRVEVDGLPVASAEHLVA